MSLNLTKPEEESLLLAAMERAYRQSPFWRSRLSGLGVMPRDLKPGFPFSGLPLLSKSELLADQAENPPFGRLLAVSPNDIRRVHKTSGTTAMPLFIALTDRDVADTYLASQRAFRLAGVGPGDRIVHCLSFNMWSGGVSDYLPLEMLGATAVPFGVGSTGMLLRTIQALRVNAISSTPSYMFVLRDRCRPELGIEPADLGLRRGYFGGEGLLQVAGIRDEIETTFRMTAVDANYGMSEVLSIIAGEGPRREGLVYHAHGVLYVELTDQAGNSIPVETGAEGELVFSSLRREGQPLFRYRTNDLARILWSDIGEDGLVRMRFEIKGRSDEMLVIKGVNFFPQSLASVLGRFEPEVTRAFRVVRPTPGEIEALHVLLETGNPEGAGREALAARIAQHVASTFQIKIAIDWLPPGRLPQDAIKKRILVGSISEI
ncbi:MAG: AMP-binding protein [Acidobacteriota bacterium]